MPEVKYPDPSGANLLKRSQVMSVACSWYLTACGNKNRKRGYGYDKKCNG